jgi:hypothetical protein
MVSNIADTHAVPYSAVALVPVTSDGSASHGSGVLIAPDELLTAASVLWMSGAGAASSIEILPDLHETDTPFGSAGDNYLIDQVEIATPDASTASLTNQIDPGSGSNGSPLRTVFPNQGACQLVDVVSSATTFAALTGSMVQMVNAWITTDRSAQLPKGSIAIAVPKMRHTITTEAGEAWKS